MTNTLALVGKYLSSTYLAVLWHFGDRISIQTRKVMAVLLSLQILVSWFLSVLIKVDVQKCRALILNQYQHTDVNKFYSSYDISLLIQVNICKLEIALVNPMLKMPRDLLENIFIYYLLLYHGEWPCI